jgi:hypothetical protein
VTSISNRAFAGCKFTGIIVDSNNASFKFASHDSVGANCYVLLPTADHESDDFNYTSDQPVGCLAVGHLVIPTTGVASIGDRAFYGCSGLDENLTIPGSVHSIGDNAFQDCTNLTGTLDLGGVTSIGSNAFYNCSGLNGTLIIPNSVTSIDDRAFANCSGLTALDLGNVTSIGNSAFYNCSGFTGNLTIPNSVTSIGIATFGGCKFTGFNVADGNTSFKLASHDSVGSANILLPTADHESNDFDYANDRPVGCLAIGNLTIPEGVTSIGSSAFAICSGLTSFDLRNFTNGTLGSK